MRQRRLRQLRQIRLARLRRLKLLKSLRVPTHKPSKPKLKTVVREGKSVILIFYQGQWRPYTTYFTKWLYSEYTKYRIVNGRRVRYMYYRRRWQPFNARHWKSFNSRVHNLGGRSTVEYWQTKKRWVVDAPKKAKITYRVVDGQRVKVFWYNGAWRNYAQYYTQYIQYTNIAYRNVNGRKIKYMYYRGQWVPFDAKDWALYILSITVAPTKPRFMYRTINGVRTKFFYYNGGWRNYILYYSQYIQYTRVQATMINGKQVQVMYYNGKWVPFNASLWNTYISQVSPKPVKPKPQFRFRVVNGVRRKFMFYNGHWRPYSHILWMHFIQNNYLQLITVGTKRVRYMYYLGQWVPYNEQLWQTYLTRVKNPKQGPVTQYRTLYGQRVKYMYYQGSWVPYNSALWNQWVGLNTQVRSASHSKWSGWKCDAQGVCTQIVTKTVTVPVVEETVVVQQ